jgi:hypothetical protein
VCNVIGQQVALLIDQERSAGTYAVQWRPDGASSVYYCRLQAVTLDGFGTVVRSAKVLLMR